MQNDNDVSNLNDWALSQSIPELFPQFPQSTINYLLRERESNGLSDAVRVIGRSRYIHIKRFAEWLDGGSRRTRNVASKKQCFDLQSEGEARV